LSNVLKTSAGEFQDFQVIHPSSVAMSGTNARPAFMRFVMRVQILQWVLNSVANGRQQTDVLEFGIVRANRFLILFLFLLEAAPISGCTRDFR
jgi:hypothetical protein